MTTDCELIDPRGILPGAETVEKVETMRRALMLGSDTIVVRLQILRSAIKRGLRMPAKFKDMLHRDIVDMISLLCSLDDSEWTALANAPDGDEVVPDAIYMAGAAVEPESL